jgi:hypothetical protein
MQNARSLAVALAFGAMIAGLGLPSTGIAAPFGGLGALRLEETGLVQDVHYRRRPRAHSGGDVLAGALLGAVIVGGIAAIANSEERRHAYRSHRYNPYGQPIFAPPPSHGSVDGFEDDVYRPDPHPQYAPQSYYAPQTRYAPQPHYAPVEEFYPLPGRPGYVGGPRYERRLRQAIPSNDPSLSTR